MSARRRELLAGAAVAFGWASGLAGCAAPAKVAAPSIPPPPPVPRVGDRWRYARVNLYNGLKLGESTMRVTALAPRLRIEVSDQPGDRVAEEVYADPWRVLHEPAYGLPMDFAAPCPLLPARLEPGAHERYSGLYSSPAIESPGGRGYYWSVWVDARDWERLQVPAGSFDALRVTRRIAFTHPDFTRLDSVRTETLWYAPRVNRWVRREWTGHYRLHGFPPTRNREDWIAWELIEYVQAMA